VVVNANNATCPDLFQAPKGASNNFGLVTRFELKASEQGSLWGSIIFYPAEMAPQQYEALVRFSNGITKDAFGSLSIFWT